MATPGATGAPDPATTLRCREDPVAMTGHL
jgi:hypothetical protein